jgi:hypothetical protein
VPTGTGRLRAGPTLPVPIPIPVYPRNRSPGSRARFATTPGPGTRPHRPTSLAKLPAKLGPRFGPGRGRAGPAQNRGRGPGRKDATLGATMLPPRLTPPAPQPAQAGAGPAGGFVSGGCLGGKWPPRAGAPALTAIRGAPGRAPPVAPSPPCAGGALAAPGPMAQGGAARGRRGAGRAIPRPLRGRPRLGPGASVL